ncbi:MAG: RNase adapter RapZ [Candidatus Melainabacteria bacterium]
MAVEPSRMPFLVLGPSGSGITTVLDAFGEFGFVQVADIPPDRLPAMAAAMAGAGSPVVFHAAFTPADESNLPAFRSAVATLQQTDGLKVLTLDAPENVLVQRYLDMDRPHRLQSHGVHALADAVAVECGLFRQVADLKDYAINTGAMEPRELRMKIAKVLGMPVDGQTMTVVIQTFGFKYGVPADAELVYDMRFIRNPFYEPELQPMTGLDKPVQTYIEAQEGMPDWTDRWVSVTADMLAGFLREGKARQNIAVGCTGGKHRSVHMALKLAEGLAKRFPDWKINMVHRESFRWPEQRSAKTV